MHEGQFQTCVKDWEWRECVSWDGLSSLCTSCIPAVTHSISKKMETQMHNVLKAASGHKYSRCSHNRFRICIAVLWIGSHAASGDFPPERQHMCSERREVKRFESWRSIKEFMTSINLYQPQLWQASGSGVQLKSHEIISLPGWSVLIAAGREWSSEQKKITSATVISSDRFCVCDGDFVSSRIHNTDKYSSYGRLQSNEGPGNNWFSAGVTLNMFLN